MPTRLFFTLLFALAAAAIACEPERRRSSDDDDDDSSGSFTVGATNGSGGGAVAGPGGVGGASGVGGAGPAGPTTTTAATTTTGPSDGICNSGLTTGSANYDGCLTDSCCTSFNACVANATCSACLTDSTGCEGNSLFNAFTTCSENACPTDICDTGIGFTLGSEPHIACNACADQFCCAHLTTCVQGGSDDEVNQCLVCLADPDGLACEEVTPGVRDAAIDFNACVDTQCSTQCS